MENDSDITIRWYNSDDYEQVEALVRELAGIFGDPFDKRWFKVYMDKRAMEPVPGCFVAHCADRSEIVGSVFCDVLRDPTGSPYGYISNVMVKKDCRGRGIGRMLIQRAVEYLTVTGVPRIWANVREETAAMVHLFEKSNFERKFIVMELKTPPYGI